MKNEFSSFWGELFRWLITFLVFGFYTAITFFSLTGNWDFLNEFSYWFDLASSTTLAWFLRYMWTFKGLEHMLFTSSDIKEKEQGKGKVIADINSNNLTDILQVEIDIANKKEKLKQYKIKCERKIRKFRNKKYKKRRLKYWVNERIECDKEDLDIDAVKVKYYRYDIDSMLSSAYRPSHEVDVRGNINSEIFKSFRVSIITMLAFAVLGAVQLWLKDYSTDDLVILIGKFIIFIINIFSGYSLGTRFVNSKYSNDLTKDYAFMKRVLKQNPPSLVKTE